MDIFRFRDFQVYKDVRRFRRDVKDISSNFPEEERFVLRSQLWRALDSVVLNIAEGSDRHSDKDFSHFLNTALGSLNEVVACLDCALDDKYVTHDEHDSSLSKAENVVRQLKAFLARVRRDDRRF